MKKTTLVCCSGCGKHFEKETKYVTSARKKNRPHFCTPACLGLSNLKKGKEKIDKWNYGEENRKNLQLLSRNRADEYTGFRNLLSSCHKRKKDCDLDLPYLKELWEKQNGKCTVTNVDLVLKTNYNKNFQASLDRIDSDKGYIKGNVRYISVSANWLKNNLDDNHLKEFIQICNGSKLIF